MARTDESDRLHVFIPRMLRRARRREVTRPGKSERRNSQKAICNLGSDRVGQDA